ncbi:FUSC family protein [Rhodoblastus sp.]|jgi:uncharacterized membrane protein YccC|uniref:FUSC family protein n=1 Tax=Rhodoblastus sp. TaxID=1962975 RepID=UPI0025DF39D1|nr:FUSC family protein [Rhodoblastus sp.]
MTLPASPVAADRDASSARDWPRLAFAALLIAPIASLRALAAHLVAPAAALHAARTVIAGLIALWLAFLLQLDTPYSALTTVMLVANPVQGMILEKSLFRLGGTFLGGLAALTLMSFFAQTPELFLLGLAAWMALCTAASTLLRGHRSYGAVLAGYTVALIALPAADAPESVFSIAMARLGAVGLGVIVSGLVGALLTGHTAQRRLDALLRDLLTDLVAVGRAALQAEPGGALAPRLHKLGTRLGGLDDAIRFAVAETPEVAGAAPSLRAAAAALHGALSAAPGLRDFLAQSACPGTRAADWAREADALLARADAALARRDPGDLEQVASELRRLSDELDALFTRRSDDARDLTEATLIAADKLGDFLDVLARGFAGLIRLETGRGDGGGLRNATHLDWAWARLNAARSAIAVLVAGTLWIGLAWPQGPMMMLGVVPTIGLFALRERPSSDLVQFAWGTAAAALLGLFYLLWVLPQIDSFALLTMWLAPPLAFGAAAATSPAAAFFAQGFTVFLITLLAPSNPMVFDPTVFLNNAFAITLGCIITALVYRIVLPVDARRLKRHLLREVQRDLFAVLRSKATIDPRQWESRMHDRMRLLSARLRAADIEAHPAMGAAFDALRLGREVFRMRNLLASDAEATAVAKNGLRPIADGRSRADALDALAAARAWFEIRRSERPEEAARAIRIEAALSSIAALYARRARFFQQAASA